jgi:hypothetical protein
MDLRRVAALVAATIALSCSGARHRKVAGPPPEYEPPEPPDAWTPTVSTSPRDAGTQ